MTEVVVKQDVWLDQQTLTCPDTLMGPHVLLQHRMMLSTEVCCREHQGVA